MNKVEIRTLEGVRALVLPSDMALEGDEVYAHRDSVTGDVVLSTQPRSWEGYFRLHAGGEVPQDFMTEADRRGAAPLDPDVEGLVSAWHRIAGGMGFPAEFDGDATTDAYRATVALESVLREHLAMTNDTRLLALIYFLELAVRGMERALWPREP